MSEPQPRLKPTPNAAEPGASGPRSDYDAVVVGAGFAGLYMLHRLRELGLSVRVYEAGSGIGGTWFWNRYPGARCDVESMEYSYQFSKELQQEWEWSERYASQPEILRYIEHVADRFDLRRDIQLHTRVVAATFDQVTGRWDVELAADPDPACARVAAGGAHRAGPGAGGERVSAQHVVLATGCLSVRNTPKFPGLESFAGTWYHTGNWPHQGVDFTGQRVAVIGTGSSAVQSIPLIARQAAHLYVFQRTPNYSVPARNQPLDAEEVARVKAEYDELRRRASQVGFGIDLAPSERLAAEDSAQERRREFEARWRKGGFSFLGAYADLVFDRESNDAAAEFVREKIRSVVKDPKVAELLCPDTTIGCKRLCLDTGYYETFNRPNVTLIDVSSSPIEEVTRDGVRVDGQDYEVDSLVLATGFDAMTGSLLAIDIRGRGGRTLRQKWVEGPRSYLGLQSAGFPNLFIITGPQSPSVLTNMLPSIEQHVNWIADCIDHLRQRDLATIEPTVEAEDEWVAHVNEVAGTTLLLTCNSWYLGANVPGKPRVFMPYLGFPTYVAKCEEVVANGYAGFVLTAPSGAVGVPGGAAVPAPQG
ncbi:MAG TPA: NAD(P)/FAD-dependent oxidoreductase [Thermoanaerobaculia bacterium]|nr:NAD(P)/FAD-dependent oxidoreductase [Thermoanaerobaculia bacterium]